MSFVGVISGLMGTLSCEVPGGFRLTQNWSDSGKIEQLSNRQAEAIHLMRKGKYLCLGAQVVPACHST